MTFASTGSARNIMALAIVAVVHLMLFYALSRIRSEKWSEVDEFRGTWITIETRGRERKKPNAKSTERLPIARPPTNDVDEIQTAEPQSASSNEILKVDWRAEGAQVAGDIADLYANKKGRASFSPMPQTIEQRSSVIGPRSVFFAPVRKLGDTEHFDDAEIITWVSDECYATNRPFAGPQLDENRLNIVCKDPFKARTDLFDELKAKYLRGLPGQGSDSAVQGK